MARELLFEIGTEEIPSRFMAGSMSQLADDAAAAFQQARLEHGAIRTYGTPRRLCLVVEGLVDRQPDEHKTYTGMPVAAAYKDGEPTKGLLGFVKAKGAAMDAVYEVDGPKGKVVAVDVLEKGEATMTLLPGLLEKLVAGLRFPKSMRFVPGSKFRYARPIRWLCAVYGGQTVPVRLEGMTATDGSYGHRFISGGRFKAKDFASYKEQLQERYVVLDPAEREAIIRKGVEAVEGDLGARALLDDDLLETLVHLVEHPLILTGTFDEAFLEVPDAVLVSSMKGHQKYIPLVSKEGHLLNTFILVSNNLNDNVGAIRQGNERVLAARLSDARFFYQEDLRHPLEHHLEGLKRVTFHVKLGSVHAKAQRLKGLVRQIATHVANSVSPETVEQAERAALLCKCDLTTQLVTEFTELQGQIGEVYAERDGEPKAVAAAIADHYLPRFREDSLPREMTGTLLALADKLDSLVGIFATGYEPRGSEDPYALRRQTLGILRLLREQDLRVSLPVLIDAAARPYHQVLEQVPEGLNERVFAYVLDRLKHDLLSEGLPSDVIEAVYNGDVDDVIDARKRITALEHHSRDREAFEPVIVVLKRVMNIIPEGFQASDVDPQHFEDDAETKLWEEFSQRRPAFEEALQKENYGTFLSQTVALKPTIDAFFEAVLVNAKDAAVKQNRLSLLHAIGSTLRQFADFTRLA